MNNCSGRDPYTRIKTGGASVQVDDNLAFGTLTSITSYRIQDQRYDTDILGIPVGIAAQYQTVAGVDSGYGATPVTQDRNLVSQELRFTSPGNRVVTFVGGLYFQRASYNQDAPSLVDLHLPFLPPGAVINVTPFSSYYKSDADDYGVFGNATWNLLPGLRLIGGLRYTYSDISEHETNPGTAAPTPQFFATHASDVTFRAGAQKDVGPHTMLYATASSGFKAPEINDALIAGANPKTPNTAELFGVAPERPLSFEAGVKTTLFGGRLNLAGDGFYTIVRNLQTQSCIPNAVTGIICGDINVHQVTTKGFEMEAFGRPFVNTTVNLSGIYNDATYPVGFRGADDTDMGGQQLNNAPKWKFTLSGEQDFPINDIYHVALGVDVTYKTGQSLYLSALPSYRVGSETQLNARMTLVSSRGWTVSLFGRNLTNQIIPTSYYPTQAFQAGGNWQTLDPASRRIAGVQAEYRF